MQGHATEIQGKDDEIRRLHQKVENIEKSMASGEEMAVKSLDGMADLEAKLAFVKNEKHEINQELEYVRQNKNSQIQELKDQLQEL